MRICSFLPSATEIVYALGLGEELVGVTYTCDFPPEARKKPVVVNTRMAPTDNPADLDRQVSDFVARGESLCQVDMEKLEALAPDLILTQDLCHVCAASPGDLAGALSRLPLRPRILCLTPQTLTDVFADIRRVGEASGRAKASERLVAELEESVAEVEQAVAGVLERPRVLCLEWLNPPYVGGHWGPDMVERAGGTDVLGRTGEPSRRVTWESVLDSNPEVIVVMPCGYDLEQTVSQFRHTDLPPGWDQLSAVRAGKVFAVDATSYFSRPGPRLALGLRVLAHILHPKRIPLASLSGSMAKL